MADEDDNSKVYKAHINEYHKNWMRIKRNGDLIPRKRGKKPRLVMEDIPKEKDAGEQAYQQNYHKLYLKRPGVRKKINDYTRDYLNERRQKKYKKEISDCFPKDDIINQLEEKDIEEVILKRDIHNILVQKDALSKGKRAKVLYDPLWAEAIDRFMQEIGYVKDGSKYVPIKK